MYNANHVRLPLDSLKQVRLARRAYEGNQSPYRCSSSPPTRPRLRRLAARQRENMQLRPRDEGRCGFHPLFLNSQQLPAPKASDWMRTSNIEKLTVSGLRPVVWRAFQQSYAASTLALKRSKLNESQITNLTQPAKVGRSRCDVRAAQWAGSFQVSLGQRPSDSNQESASAESAV